MCSKYIYEGPVYCFGKMLTNHWKGETWAPSEQKARSNLMYRYKKQTGLLPGGSVTLPGKIKMVI